MFVLPDPVYGNPFRQKAQYRFAWFDDREVYLIGVPEPDTNRKAGMAETEEQAKAVIAAYVKKWHDAQEHPVADVSVVSERLEGRLAYELDLRTVQAVQPPRMARGIHLVAAESGGPVWETWNGEGYARVVDGQPGVSAVHLDEGNLYYGTVNSDLYCTDYNHHVRMDAGAVHSILGRHTDGLVVAVGQKGNLTLLVDRLDLQPPPTPRSPIHGTRCPGPVCLHKDEIVLPSKPSMQELFSDGKELYAVMQDAVYRVEPEARLFARKGRQYRAMGKHLYYIPDNDTGVVMLNSKTGKETKYFPGKRITAFAVERESRLKDAQPDKP